MPSGRPLGARIFVAVAAALAMLLLGAALGLLIRVPSFDRAEPGRLGATMATYSMGFPLGNGVGAITWGLVITAVGFPAPFLLALGVLAAIAALVWSARADLLRGSAVRERG